MRHRWIIAPAGDAGLPGVDEPRLDQPRPDQPRSDQPEPGQPEPLADVTAHARLRGPFTAAGAVVRALVPDALTRLPELVRRHDIELLTAAPELADVLTASRSSLADQEPLDTRTRQRPRDWAVRVAHGLTEFVLGYLTALDLRRTLVVREVDSAEQTDVDWLAVLLRRADPHRLRVLVHTRADTVAAPLDAALASHADRVDHAAWPVADADAEDGEDWAGDDRTGDDTDDRVTALARCYVHSDGLSGDPRHRAAYQELPAEQRARLHDERAAALIATAEPALRLGAIPHHLERGSDPTGTAPEVLIEAMAHCRRHGLFHALLDYSRRCAALLDWDTHPRECWQTLQGMTEALRALGRAEESRQLWERACARSTLPVLHLRAACERAVQHARTDPEAARAWANTAIVLSGLSGDPATAAFDRTCAETAMALVEAHLGEVDAALRRIDRALDHLAASAEPDTLVAPAAVLREHRARLLASAGRTDEAITEYTALLAVDPNHADHHLNRGELHWRQGRTAEAVADFAAAGQTSPPHPEPHHRRGLVLLDSGRLTEAVTDFDRVLDLDPDFLDAHVHRASARYQLGDPAGAAEDIAAGLARHPDHAHLLCLRGLLAQDAGDLDGARADFTLALRHDDGLADAWASLGVLAFEQGEVEESLDHFDRALELADAPSVRAHRAFARHRAGRCAEATVDCTVALTMVADEDRTERADLLLRRAACRLHAGDRAGAETDLADALSLAPGIAVADPDLVGLTTVEGVLATP